MTYEDVKDSALELCFKSGLLGAFWVKRKDNLEIVGLRLVFENNANLFIGSKDQEEIIIEVINPDGSIQRNIERTEE